MADGASGIGNAITSVPIGEMVRAMAMAIADAQFELDKSSMIAAEFMSGRRPLRDGQGQYLLDDKGRPLVEESLVQFGYTADADGKRVPNMVSMLELGFVPTFYQFVDTVIEVKLALRVSQAPPAIDPGTGDVKVPGKGSGTGLTVSSAPVDALYAGAYNFNLELASVFRTKLVCVPPPAALEERLRALAQDGGVARQGQG
jgi:hypothetical protein